MRDRSRSDWGANKPAEHLQFCFLSGMMGLDMRMSVWDSPYITACRGHIDGHLSFVSQALNDTRA